MPPSTLSLNAIRVFAVVARSERNKDAADRLGVTSSAVSQQMKSLSQWIGAPLFEVNRRRPVLTPVGRTLLEAVEGPISQIESALMAIRRKVGSKSIVVSAPVAYLSHRLVPKLSEFWAKNPDMEIDLRPALRFDEAVDLHHIDVAIRFIDTPGAGQPIGRKGWSAFCRPDYYEALGRPASISDLREATLLHEHVFNFWPKAFELSGARVPDSVTFHPLGDAATVVSGIMSGGAVALLPSELPRELVRNGVLVSPFRAKIEPDASYAIFHDQVGASDSVKRLVNHIAVSE